MKRILLIGTGGTIASEMTEDGLAPKLGSNQLLNYIPHVSEICDDIGMNQPAVSHQLKALKTGKLIKSRRDGKAIYYSLDDDHVKTIIAMGKEHIEE